MTRFPGTPACSSDADGDGDGDAAMIGGRPVRAALWGYAVVGVVRNDTEGDLPKT
ncbi:hypothetical protein MOQ72_35255 [Saccharopolyspora sp. K220]|nr:hypothetical protein [Saccharopolyspora soli]